MTETKAASDADRAIGSRIAAIRSAQGMSQTTLAGALGISFQQVQKYEKGRNRIAVGRLHAIAEKLSISVEELMSDTSPNTGSSFLEDPDAMELLMAFRKITDPTMREKVLTIVKSVAAVND
jgi:transcriptional regulator with XRE-family HTH domain